MTADSGRVLLDVTRLFARMHRTTPRGIDRVCLRYAQRYLDDERALFCATANGTWYLVPASWVRRSCNALTARWQGDRRAKMRVFSRAIARMVRDRQVREKTIASLGDPLQADKFPLEQRLTYINVSHRELRHLGSLRQALSPRELAIVVMVHDLMPITRPSEHSPSLRRSFEAGLEATRLNADLVLTNSSVTADEVVAHWSRPGLPRPARSRGPSIVTLTLGTEACEFRDVSSGSRASMSPYFVHLGTIEHRKNVQVLLAVWEQLIERGGDVPQLDLLGAANDAELAERARKLAPHVSITSNLDDRRVREKLCGARALLAPSIAEGFGLPVTEALCLGTPVICSDIPSLHEASQEVAEFVAVDDVEGWEMAVSAYAETHSFLRESQLARLQYFRPMRWETHFERLDEALADLRREFQADHEVREPSSAAG